jgi:hypothetical protein
MISRFAIRVITPDGNDQIKGVFTQPPQGGAMATKQKKKFEKKKKKKQKQKERSSLAPAPLYPAIKIKKRCPKCGTMLQPGDTRCRNKKKCNARFEEA